MLRYGIAIVVLVATAGGAPAAAPDPEQVVRDLNAGLLEIMKESQALGYEGRFERVEPLLDASFDVPFMAEKSLGREWRALDEAARARWVALFREFMIANYAGRFDAYTGETFEHFGRTDGAYDTVMVNTRLVIPREDDVDLDYRLHQTPDGWRVVDIYLKGSVSELAVRRADYTAVVKRGGFAELSAYLRERIEALKTGTAE